MHRTRFLVLTMVLVLTGAESFADEFDDMFVTQEHSSWKSYMRENRYTCPGPFQELSADRTVEVGGKLYKHSGYRLELIPEDADKDDVVKIGILSAIKDLTAGTQRNLKESLDWFREEKVEWIVLNGDIAKGEFDFEEIVDLVLKENVPLLVVLGNLDSKGSWARVYKNRYEKFPNLINGVWIRQIVADDVEFWTLPGYHDKRFVHQDGGCLYKKEDVDLMRKEMKPSKRAPLVLVAHGPPRGVGLTAIDLIYDKENVGDRDMNSLIDRVGIQFGLFGHILECGGLAVRGDMKTRVREGVASSDLYLNAGSVSGDPWNLNTGAVSYGMSVVVTLKGAKASYQTRRFKAFFEE